MDNKKDGCVQSTHVSLYCHFSQHGIYQESDTTDWMMKTLNLCSFSNCLLSVDMLSISDSKGQRLSDGRQTRHVCGARCIIPISRQETHKKVRYWKRFMFSLNEAEILHLCLQVHNCSEFARFQNEEVRGETWARPAFFVLTAARIKNRISYNILYEDLNFSRRFTERQICGRRDKLVRQR